MPNQTLRQFNTKWSLLFRGSPQYMASFTTKQCACRPACGSLFSLLSRENCIVNDYIDTCHTYVFCFWRSMGYSKRVCILLTAFSPIPEPEISHMYFIGMMTKHDKHTRISAKQSNVLVKQGTYEYPYTYIHFHAYLRLSKARALSSLVARNNCYHSYVLIPHGISHSATLRPIHCPLCAHMTDLVDLSLCHLNILSFSPLILLTV